MIEYLKPKEKWYFFFAPWKYKKHVEEINERNQQTYLIERVRREIDKEKPVGPPNIYELQ